MGTLGHRLVQGALTAYLLALVAAVVVYKGAFLHRFLEDPFFVTYGLVVCTYILSRFGFSLFYRTGAATPGHEPKVAIIMPAFNEEDAVARSVRSLLTVDYPTDKIEIVVIDDGSTDATAAEILRVEAEAPTACA